MSATRLTALLLLYLVTATSYAASSADQRSDKLFAVVLNTARAGDYPGTLDSVSLLDKKGGRRAERFLVRLLDYYVGEGPTLALDEAITRRGKRMLPLLDTLRSRNLQCLEEFTNICMSIFPDGRELRNERIEQLTQAIKKGVVLKADN